MCLRYVTVNILKRVAFKNDKEKILRKVTNESFLLSEASRICAIIVNAVFENTTWNNQKDVYFH